jgi:hypothetical protein
MARGKKTGGRKLGTPNKVTIERALLAERAVGEAKAQGQKLAVEALDHYMHDFLAIAAGFRELGDLAKFEVWAGRAIECAKALAPFQSPRLSAVAIGAAVINRIEVVGGLPDEQDGSFLPAPPVAPECAGSSIPDAAKTSAEGAADCPAGQATAT